MGVTDGRCGHINLAQCFLLLILCHVLILSNACAAGQALHVYFS
jgi:hypothetical protein